MDAGTGCYTHDAVLVVDGGDGACDVGAMAINITRAGWAISEVNRLHHIHITVRDAGIEEEDFDARPRFLPRWEELEEDADYRGGMGEGGLPEGEGRLWFPEDGATFGGRRRKEEEEDAGLALRSVEGNFRKGLLEGPAVLIYEVSLTRFMKAHANSPSLQQ